MTLDDRINRNVEFYTTEKLFTLLDLISFANYYAATAYETIKHTTTFEETGLAFLQILQEWGDFKAETESGIIHGAIEFAKQYNKVKEN